MKAIILLMSSLILNERITKFTQKSDLIQKRETQKGTALFRVKESWLQLTNINQLDHIIHNLVVENGFMMNSCSKSKVDFTHSKNDFNNTTTYSYTPEKMEMYKYEEEFLTFV